MPSLSHSLAFIHTYTFSYARIFGFSLNVGAPLT
jgi:hypothetical protein